MAICRKCGNFFEPRGKNHLDCSECCFYTKSSMGRMVLKLQQAEARFREELADQVKVYRAEECSQEFLRGLIPR